jgi:hypothetical protein
MGTELRKLCEQVPEPDWRPYEERAHEVVCYAEVEFAPGDWSKTVRPLRTLVLRVLKRQGQLFANGSDRLYLGGVTGDEPSDAASLIRWHYQQPGHIEIVHDVALRTQMEVLGAEFTPSADADASCGAPRLSRARRPPSTRSLG